MLLGKTGVEDQGASTTDGAHIRLCMQEAQKFNPQQLSTFSSNPKHRPEEPHLDTVEHVWGKPNEKQDLERKKEK